MNTNSKVLAISAVALAMTMLTGCVHLESVSTTSVPEDRTRVVEVEASRFVFMYLNFDNDYVSELSEGLAKDCPKGRVEGVLTKFESITWFPAFAHTMRITATGYCVEREAPASPETAQPEAESAEPSKVKVLEEVKP